MSLARALGGDFLADVAVLRAEPAGVFGQVASEATVSRAIAVPGAEPEKALRAKDPD